MMPSTFYANAVSNSMHSASASCSYTDRWRALANDLPPMLDSLQRWIDNRQSDSAP
jgi:hypothetical protein